MDTAASAPGSVPAEAAELFPDVELISQYVDILTNRGMEWGLLGPREGARIWERHIFNSVSFQSLIPQGARVADVGSGAGLPGIPLALARPDLKITLIESLLRRVSFLELAVDELGLADQVTVRRARAEEIKESFDVVTARAVAPLKKLLGWTIPLFSPAGELLALKGSTAADEVVEADDLLKRRKLAASVIDAQAYPGAETTSVIRVVKQSR